MIVNSSKINESQITLTQLITPPPKNTNPHLSEELIKNKQYESEKYVVRRKPQSYCPTKKSKSNFNYQLILTQMIPSTSPSPSPSPSPSLSL